MTGYAESERAISALSGTELNGRAPTINEALPKAERTGGGGGGGYGGGRRNNRW
jgi:hypothetical protein